MVKNLWNSNGLRERFLLVNDTGQFRIAVIGPTGSGKTTLSRQIGKKLEITPVDLDALHWEAGWKPAPLEIFRSEVNQALSAPAWVTSGNYSKVRDLVWSKANTLVWLDYSLAVCGWRLFKRTLQRVFTQEKLWNGNHESFRGQFLSKDSLFLWLVQSQPRQRREYPNLFQQPEYKHLEIHRFESPKETQNWLDRL